MTLQSESRIDLDTSVSGCLPLVSSAVQEITPLEFESIDLFEEIVQGESNSLGTGPKSAVEEEIIALREELGSRTEYETQRQAEHDRVITSARREWEAVLETKIQSERQALVEAVHAFNGERSRYFAAVEGEIVKLALAIAARVLHREATVDPMLLRGVVRVALSQIADESSTVLRVSADEVESWHAMSEAESGAFPQVLADKRLAPGECVLDTNMGKVELGIAAQLQEIERGFFDLLQRRPA